MFQSNYIYLNLTTYMYYFKIFSSKRFIVKNPLRFYGEKKCSIHYLYFSFEKHVPSQVLKDFSVENLETTPCTFLSNFSSEIYLSRIIVYWDSIFTLYLTLGAFSLACVLSVFCFFLSSFFFLFCRYSLKTDTNHSQDSREERGNHYLFCF